jgi:predicted metalloprotease with PDZ domain
MINKLRALISRTALLSLLLLAVSIATHGQETPLKIDYRLAMPQPNSHLFEVTIEVDIPAASKVESLDFQMAKWSPGRYAVFDFAKNVQEVNARVGCRRQYDERGNPLPMNCPESVVPVLRVDDQTWRPDLIGNKNATLTFNYKVYANDLSGTFSELDSRHANFNGGSIFMYVVNHKQDPVGLSIAAPKNWRIVNGRMTKRDQREWRFPNWDLMIDTPTEIAPDWSENIFQVEGKTYHVIVHSLGPEGGKRPALVRDIERIVKAEIAMWGPPEFDSYTFLIHFANDGISGDGMEHLTSTQIIQPGALADPGMLEETLDTVAHEFFHVWNVKRLRPIELGPWDFTRPANTRGLWIAEGITNYYGHLMQRRAGLLNDEQFWAKLVAEITQVENAPGSRLMSAEDSSLSAPFIDDAPHAQQTNLANTAVSYYPKGEVIGLALDLLIRGKTHGQASLDDVMRRMYEEFYLKSPNATYYLRGRGYRNEDFARVVSEVTGADMSDFFKRYVRGVEPPPYEAAFAQVGLRLTREPQHPVSVGVTGDDADTANFKIARIRPNSPAANAGWDIGDKIISLGGIRITPDNFLKIVDKYKPGDRVRATIQRGTKVIQTTIIMGPPQLMTYRIEALPNATSEAKALRAAWTLGVR